MAALSFALVGCGRIGRMHADILCRLEETGLCAVYDVVSDSAKAVADRTGAKVAASAQEAIEDAGVDAVLVASATDTHADMIQACATAGKPVLCEKPIDLDLERVKRCHEFLADHDVPVQVGFNRRFDAGHAAARKALADGEVGDLIHVIITSRDPGMPTREYYETAGGLMRDMTIHDFDLARFFLGEEPTSVFAVAGRMCDRALMDELDDHDSAMIVMRAASGTCCHVNNTRTAVYGYDQRVEVHGDKGMLLSGNNRRHNLERSTADYTARREPLLDFFIERYMQAYEDQARAFADAVANDRQIPVTFEDGMRALELAEAAYRSVETGAMVEVPGP